MLAGSWFPAAETRAAEKPLPAPKADEVDKVTAAMPDKAPAKPAKARKLLVFNLTKGFSHDSIPLAAKTFEVMGSKTGAWETVSSVDPDVFAADRLKEFDAIMMNNTTGTLFKDEALKASLLEFVRSGKGISGIHAATDCFYDWKEYGDMMGGYFDGHPFSRISVKLDDPDSPINAAFEKKGFEITDEIYIFKAPYSREKLRILQSIDWENANLKPNKRADNDYALAWIQDFGKGRVFYSAFGHQHQVFWNPKILAHWLAGIQYVMGDLKADAKPTAKLSPAPTPAPGPNLGEKKAAIERQGVTVYAAAAKADDEGWICLFDGKDLSQWQNAAGGEPGKGWIIQDGALVRSAGAGDIWTKQRFGNFVLDLEFNTDGNSGVFIRTDNPKDCVQTGIEMQVEKGGGKEKLGRNDVGSIYDCLAPGKNPFKDGEWNHVVITASNNKITIVANDVQIIDMDLDKWTEAKQNPDGSKNKFNKPLKDFKREGHIGLQDHGAKVMYRNIKVKPLTTAAAVTTSAQPK
jgi:type 1 glutamine amidotransferase